MTPSEWGGTVISLWLNYEDAINQDPWAVVIGQPMMAINEVLVTKETKKRVKRIKSYHPTEKKHSKRQL